MIPSPLSLFSSTCCIPWQYKAEGGSSVVLSFSKRCCESCNLSKEYEPILRGTILRLRKKRPNFDDKEKVTNHHLDETELLTFFQNTLGRGYVSFPLILDTEIDNTVCLIESKDVKLSLFHIPDDFLLRIHNLIIDMNCNIRPKSRRKETLELSGIASKMSNKSFA